MSKIQNTYYDALYFSTASFNSKEAFALTPVQKDVLIKLIHYSTKDEVITWSSENIHNHTCIPVGSIDKAIQRLKQKGYISVINKQVTKTYVSREITINWEKIEEIDSMYKNWVDNKEEKTPQPSNVVTTPMTIENTVETPKNEIPKVESSKKKENMMVRYNTILKYSPTYLSFPEFNSITDFKFVSDMDVYKDYKEKKETFTKDNFEAFWSFLLKHRTKLIKK